MAIADVVDRRDQARPDRMPQGHAPGPSCCSQCGTDLAAERPSAVTTCLDCTEALELAGRMTRNTGAW